MKTLKITVVATLAAMLAWYFRLPHKLWPAHPYLAIFLLSLILCWILQITWQEPARK